MLVQLYKVSVVGLRMLEQVSLSDYAFEIKTQSEASHFKVWVHFCTSKQPLLTIFLRFPYEAVYIPYFKHF